MMQEAAVTGSPRAARGWTWAGVRTALAVAIGFALALLIASMAGVVLNGPADRGALVALGILTAPLLIVLIGIALSLTKYSRRVRWGVAALFLLGVPLMIVSGASSWLLNTM